MTAVTIDLSTGTPPAPERTRQLAETFAELARVMNHQTMHHEALAEPSDADRVVRELSSAAERLPQLLSQIGRWLDLEAAADRITVPSGRYQGNPPLAVAAARIRLERAGQIAAELQEALDDAASVTSTLAAREDDDDA
jgi:hypothetical protein